MKSCLEMLLRSTASRNICYSDSKKWDFQASTGTIQNAELELGVPGIKKISGRHEAALYRSLTEKSCAQPLVPRCRSQLFCQLSLAQSKGRNEQPTDYGTKTRRKPTKELRRPGATL